MSAQEQVNHAILQAQASEARKKKAQATYDQALAEDSSVFEYDGVYDAMQEKRAASAQTRKEKEAKREPSIDGLAQPSISTTAHGSLGMHPPATTTISSWLLRLLATQRLVAIDRGGTLQLRPTRLIVGPSPSRGFGRSLAFAELLQGRLFGVRLLWTELRRSSLCAEGGSMMMLTACQPRPVVASAAQTACPISMSRPSRASAHANSTSRHFPAQ